MSPEAPRLIRLAEELNSKCCLMAGGDAWKPWTCYDVQVDH